MFNISWHSDFCGLVRKSKEKVFKLGEWDLIMKREKSAGVFFGPRKGKLFAVYKLFVCLFFVVNPKKNTKKRKENRSGNESASDGMPNIPILKDDE
jgi:hypothetical protein